MDCTKDVATGKDFTIIYYVDMENKRYLIKEDTPEVLMVRFKVFVSLSSNGGQWEMMLMHPDFHVQIPCDCEYELCAFVIRHVHHGRKTLHEGHFTSFSYHHQNQL